MRPPSQNAFHVRDHGPHLLLVRRPAVQLVSVYDACGFVNCLCTFILMRIVCGHVKCLQHELPVGGHDRAGAHLSLFGT